MFHVEFNLEPLLNTLDSMLEQLKEFPQKIGDELTEWQKEDMHRKHPNTVVAENYAETDIWPTSRLAQQRDRRKVAKVLAIKRRGGQVMVRGKSQRPILREELYEKMVKRMDALLEDELKWETD